ncbi:MAG: LAGLIDADG family homing endonuclease [Thermoproteota archaeon]
MGSGSRVGQYERRFFQGELMHEEKEEGAFNIVKTFREYEVLKAERGGYTLLKSGNTIGTLSEAKVEEERIVFKLSQGTNLEVSEKGVREILNPEKAEVCGLMAADGYICKLRWIKGEGVTYEASLTTINERLAEVFEKLSKEIYGVIPHRDIEYHKTKEGKAKHYKVAIYSKKVVFDLLDLSIKGPARYEFHPPLKHLDEEGKRAYLRGFFSGDGTVALKDEGRYEIRIDSSYRDGLEELRKMFIDLGFHPYEIHEKKYVREGKEYKSYYFTIPSEEHLKFIEEIGSEKEEHINRFRLIKQRGKERRD